MSICELNQNIIKDYDDQDVEITLYKQYGGDLPVVDSLTDLIKELNKAFMSDYVNIELVHYLMKSYKSRPSEWKQYAKFDRYR